MFFTIKCPHCTKSLKVRGDQVGRSASCPYCRKTVVIEAPAEPAAGTKKSATSQSVSAPPTGALDFLSSTPRPDSGTTPTQSSTPLSVTPDIDVHVMWHIGTGVVGTLLFYVLLWPFAWSGNSQSYLGRLFIGTSSFAQGGWVPIVEVFLFCWACGMMVEKYFKIRRQHRALLYDVLPTKIDEKISLDKIDAFIDHIRGLPANSVGSFIVTRCVRGLEHFRVRKSAPDTATMLSSQGDLDASSVDSSYTMFHVFIWAIPILGFLGTVIGVSAAVGSFTGTLEGSSDIGALKTALKGITGGLATAFDTTLVALSMAMLLTFPVSALQKQESDLLGEVDEYTNENLLRRLDDGREGGAERGIGGTRHEMRRLVAEALAPHRAEMTAWSERLRAIGTDIATEVRQGWEDINRKLLEEHGRQAERIGKIDSLVNTTQENLTGLAQDTAEARNRAATAMADAATNVQTYTASLERALSGLSDALERLEGRQIVVHSLPTRPWWSRMFGGGNHRAKRN
jgi:phage FluMu protein Com